MATVKAKPYEYEFAPEKTALIVIDMQRDFIEPGGFGETLGNKVKLLAAIVPTVKKLLEFLRPPSTRVGRQSQAWAAHAGGMASRGGPRQPDRGEKIDVRFRPDRH